MASQRERTPDTVACGNPKCPRTLNFMEYRYGYIGDDIEPERVHWKSSPLLDSDSVLCTCGHFTAYYDLATRMPPSH